MINKGAQIAKKRTIWKRDLCAALEAGKAKLTKYYNKTHGECRELYYMSTILDPSVKNIKWEMADITMSQKATWMAQFQSSYEQGYAKYEGDTVTKRRSLAFTMDIDSLAQVQEIRARHILSASNDVDRYLKSKHIDGPLLKVIPIGNTCKAILTYRRHGKTTTIL